MNNSANSEISSFMSEDNSLSEDFNKSFSFIYSKSESILAPDDNTSNDKNPTNKISIYRSNNFNHNNLNKEKILFNTNNFNNFFEQKSTNYIHNNQDKTNFLSFNQNFQNNRNNTFSNSFKDINLNLPLFHPMIQQQELNNFLFDFLL